MLLLIRKMLVKCVRCYHKKKQVEKTCEITYELLRQSCVLTITFSDANSLDLAEVKEGDSKNTLACDDDAHKVDVCTESHVFYENRSC